jgi:hypothetical protein
VVVEQARGKSVSPAGFAGWRSRLDVTYDSGPILGRCFAIYYNQTRVGRLEISPGGYSYDAKSPEVHTSIEIDQARFFDYVELTDFLGLMVWHLTSGESNQSDYKDALAAINAGLTKTLWNHYRVSEYAQSDDQDWGELQLSFHGTASSYVRRMDAPARS